jgi:uncharacterized protein (TIGR03435 family)
MIEQLTNHLWQSTVFGLAVAVLAIFFRKSGAHVRYWLWFSASIKFLIPFALLIALGRQMEWAPVQPAALPAISAAMVKMTEPFLDSATSALPASAHATGIHWIPIVLPSIWACGFLAVALMRFRLWRRIQQMVRLSSPLELTGMEMPSGLRLNSAEGFLEPGIVGIWRPTLLLPAGLENHLTPSQLRAIVAHEVSHMRRRDNLTAAIHMLVEALFWFHPLVWWIGARLVHERERACDEDVLRLLGEPEAYAEGILEVCKRYVESPLSCVSGISGPDIRKRIEGIMNNRIGLRLTFARTTVLTLAALFAFVTPIVVGSMTAALPLRQTPATPASTSSTAAQQFEAASIRPCDMNSLPPVPEGMRGGGANSFQMIPGRLHAVCMTLATLIRTAYGYGPADLEFLQGARGRGFNFNNVYGLGVEDGVRVRGGPDWVRKERYTIEAVVGSGPSDPATIQGPMLRALLEQRFQLKTHTETEDVPAFALTVGRRGVKLKPAQEGSCEKPPTVTPGTPVFLQPRSFADVRRGQKPTCGLYGQRNGPNQVLVGGEATFEALARVLGGSLGAVQVFNKTNVTDKFNFVLEFARDENAPGDPHITLPPDSEQSDVPRAATIFTVLDEQLGLRLDRDKAQRPFLVIDHVERPSPN